MTQNQSGSGGGDDEPIVITDNRKVDPETGEARSSADAAAREAQADDQHGDQPGAATSEQAPEADGGPDSDPDADPVDTAAAEADARVAELTTDLQRLQAEYANYRKREQRERQVAIANAKASVIGELLELLDDLDRAREHGDLDSGPLKAIGDKLSATLSGLGLEGFGEAGEPFDPEQHEAVQHTGEGDNPVLDTVLRRGYRVGDRVLRTAMVIVGDAGDGAPAHGGGEGSGDSGASAGESGSETASGQDGPGDAAGGTGAR